MGFLLSFLLFIPDASRHARQDDADLIWTVVTRRKTKGAQGTLREAAVNTLLGEQLRSQGRAAQPGGVRQVCGPSCAAVGLRLVNPIFTRAGPAGLQPGLQRR